MNVTVKHSKVVLVSIASLLVVALLSACGQQAAPVATSVPAAATKAPAAAAPAAPAVAPAATAAPAAQAVPAAQQITLKFYAYQNPGHYIVEEVGERFGKEVTKRTNGRIQFKMLYGTSVLKVEEGVDGIRKGVADLGWVMPGYNPGMFHLHHASELPFMFKNATAASKSIQDLRSYLEPEYNKVGLTPLWVGSSSPYEFQFRKPVRTLADMKGLKIRSAGADPSEIIKALGAVPVTVPQGDVYTAMQTGMVDGNLGTLATVQAYKLAEVGKYFVTAGIYTNHFMGAMNLDVFNKLSAEDQKIIKEVSGEASVWEGETYDKQTAPAEKHIKDAGDEIYVVPANEVARWIEATKPLENAFVKKHEDAGYPAREYVAKLWEAAKKYNPQ